MPSIASPPDLGPRLCLHPGRHRCEDVTAEQVTGAMQRAKLGAATLAIVAERGYEGLSTEKLCARAHISKRDLYRHHSGGYHDCFLELFDHASTGISERLTEAWHSGGNPAQWLRNAVEAFAEQVGSDPVVARLVLCEPFAAGPAATEAERVARERLVRRTAAALAEHGVQPAPLAVRAMIAALASVARVRLLAGAHERMRAEASLLADWACCCLQAPRAGICAERTEPAGRPSRVLLAPQARRHADPRIRIIAATAALAAEHGYAGLTEQAIREGAGATCAQMHACFPGARAGSTFAPFMAALEWMWARALTRAAAAGRAMTDWPSGIARGAGALMSCLAEDETFARLAFVELPREGGAIAMAGRLRLLAGAAAMLSGSAPRGPCPPAPVAQASVAACGTIVAEHVAGGRTRQLPALAPTLSFIALAPAVGCERAASALKVQPEAAGLAEV